MVGTNLPMRPISNSILCLAATDCDSICSTSFTALSTISRDRPVPLDRSVKFRDSEGIWPAVQQCWEGNDQNIYFTVKQVYIDIEFEFTLFIMANLTLFLA